MPINLDIKTADFPEFVKAMGQTGYFPTNLETLKVAQDCLRDMDEGPAHEGNIVGILADGEPGTGKSYLAQCLARLLNAQYLVYNCHPDSTSEELVSEPNAGAVVSALMGIEHGVLSATTLPSGSTTNSNQTIGAKAELSRAELYNMGQLLEAFMASEKGPVILLLDELDKARSAVDTVMLTAMSEGVLYLQGWGENGEVLAVRGNRKNLLIVAAKNQNRELEEALYRRFPVVWVEYPDRKVEVKMIMRDAGVGEEVAKHLVALANKLRRSQSIKKKPSFPELKRLAMDFKRTFERDCKEVEETQPDGTKVVTHIFCSVPKETLFHAVISTLQPRPKEREMALQVLNPKNAKKKPIFIGTQLLAKYAQDAGKKDNDGKTLSFQCASEQGILSSFMKD